MKRVFLALSLGLLAPQTANAATALLQTVDLTDQGLSAEGGEAKLFRLTGTSLGRCKIEAVHFGEMGRTTYRFIFDARLRYAAMREYRYAEPLSASSNVRMRVAREVLLTSAEGGRTLPGEWATYKGYFDAAKLARCAGARVK
ncbi:MAG: hypothetical protein AB7F98_15350 [Novosphingobium sp.]